MKLGIIARADDRGLGTQTWEAVRNMNPERVLVVRSPYSERQGFPVYLDRFPGATVVTWDETNYSLPAGIVQGWLEGLDVVYTAETVYDQRLVEWANNLGVATVVHVNAEMHSRQDSIPTANWVATDWEMQRIPNAQVVPMPVAVDRFPEPDYDQPGRIIHIAGKPAWEDRNGTAIALAVKQYFPVEVVPQTESNYWDNYRDASILVLPRRYGGLCLPANEACAAGAAVVMPNCSPNRYWPIEPVPCSTYRSFQTRGGDFRLHDCEPLAVADAVQNVLTNLPARRKEARAWAEDHSWEALRPLWIEQLQRAVSLCRGEPVPTVNAHGTT